MVLKITDSNLFNTVADPDPSDPYVFGPPGSGSSSQRYGSGSRSFYHHTKIVKKSWFCLPFLWLLFDFLSVKTIVNVPSKSNKQKNLGKNLLLVRILSATDEKSRIQIQGSGSVPKRHRSAILEKGGLESEEGKIGVWFLTPRALKQRSSQDYHCCLIANWSTNCWLDSQSFCLIVAVRSNTGKRIEEAQQKMKVSEWLCSAMYEL